MGGQGKQPLWPSFAQTGVALRSGQSNLDVKGTALLTASMCQILNKHGGTAGQHSSRAPRLKGFILHDYKTFVSIL